MNLVINGKNEDFKSLAVEGNTFMAVVDTNNYGKSGYCLRIYLPGDPVVIDNYIGTIYDD